MLVPSLARRGVRCQLCENESPSVFMALLSLRNVSVAFGGPETAGSGRAPDRARGTGLPAGSKWRGEEHPAAADPRRDRARRGPGHPPAGTANRSLLPRMSPAPRRPVDDQVAEGLDDGEHPVTGSDHRVQAIVSRMGLDPDARFEDLSSGMKRRVLLAQALVGEPDILLLDEPTNHLDIESIRWLEEFLLASGGTLIFVTHDRVFLEKLATRIVELDRGASTTGPATIRPS